MPTSAASQIQKIMLLCDELRPGRVLLTRAGWWGLAATVGALSGLMIDNLEVHARRAPRHA